MEPIKKKRFIKKIGMFYRIPLDCGNYGYGQVATKVDHIFFDHQDKEGEWTDPKIILEKPIVFYATVDWYVLKDGLWEILGIYPVKSEHQTFPDPFTYNPFKKTYGIFMSGKGFVPCSREEIEGRECLSSWGHGSIEQRLRDHFARRPNYDVEQDKSMLSYYRKDNPATHHLPKFPSRHEFYRRYGYEFTYLPEVKDEDDNKIKDK